MPTVEIAEQPGGERSEDVVLALDNAVALLDGATSLRPTTYTGGWYAATLAETLRPRLATDDDLAEVLADGISEVCSTHQLQPGSAPSSTVALLRWDDTTVQALVLADSPIVLFTGDGEHVVADDRLANLRSEGRGGYRQRLRSGGGFDEQHHVELRTAVDATGTWRNVDGGFWVAEAEPQAAYRAIRGQWRRDDVRAVLVASDGVSCGVDDYNIFPDWSSVLDCALSHGTHTVLERVRAAELSDPDGRRWPRPKRHDDQSLALVRFAE